MTLVQLRYFLMVCDCESTSRAAEKLNISQPSVSSAIRELEAEFNVVLFHRQYRGMKLTEAGEAFRKLADQLLSHADRVVTSMQDISRKSRVIRLGIPPMIGSLFLPQIYHSFSKTFSGIRIEVEEHGRNTLIRQMETGEIDLAFISHTRPFGSDFQAVKLADMETVCCVSPMHPLANRRKISIPELDHQQLVLFKNSSFQTEAILQRFYGENLQPQVLLYSDQVSTVRRLIARNLAVGFMYSSLSNSLTDVVSIPLDPPMKVQVSLVWKTEALISREQEAFIRFVQENIPISSISENLF